MSLTISLINSGDTDQLITLFDNGGSGTSTFVNAGNNVALVPQTNVVTTPFSFPQNIIISNQIYYETLFNPSNNLTYLSALNQISIIIFYLGNAYTISIAVIPSGLTLNQLNELITNSIKNNIYDPRPNASFQFSLQSVNGVNFLIPYLFDDIQDTSIFSYNQIDISSNGQYLTSYPLNQAYTYSQNSIQIYLSTFPNVSFEEDGWHTIQCSGSLTSPSSQVRIGFFDSYMGFPTAVTLQVQLTQTLAQNFIVNDGVSNQIILGNTTAIQTFSLVFASNVLFRLAGGFPSGYGGQLKVRAFPNGSTLVSQSRVYSLPTSINSYLQGNPNVTAKGSVTGVGLTEVLNSVIGNSYKVTSLYIWSMNPVQLTQSITYGIKDANGNIVQTDLDIVIDPYAQNSVTYRTNGMDGFIIDNNAFIQFILKAQTAVNMKMEYEVLSYDEIREQAIASDLDLQGIEKQKEILDLEYGTPGSDLDDFYTLQ